MEVEDSYKELGIPHDSSDADVKAAWRRLAARWHPDRNSSPAALRKIQRINRALEEIRKARRMSADARDAAGSEAAPDAAPARSRQEQGQRSDAASSAGRTFRHTVSLSLEEACAGCVRDLQGEVVDPCGACGATGVDPAPRACATCEGTGQVRQALWFGWLSAPAECAECRGRGEVPRGCLACEGTGRAAARSYKARVRIPPGMRHGGQLHVAARSRRGAAGRTEALAIDIEVRPHAFFALDDDGTVRCEVPVDGFAWMAECWTDVPTPSGLQQMRLRRGHLMYRIKGAGFPVPGTRSRADCLVTVSPLFPQELDARQQALIEQLVACHSGSPDTPAGRTMNAWQQGLAEWQLGLPDGPPSGAP